MPVLTNDDFTKIEKTLNPLYYQEYKEEIGDRGPLSWQVNNKIENDFSMVADLVGDKVKTFVINSEDNTMPKKTRDNLSFYYVTF